MPQVGFEPTISSGERPQTYALDRAATGTGRDETTASEKRQHLWLLSDQDYRNLLHDRETNYET